MSDYTKRLAEIEADHAREEQIVALGCEPASRHVERGWLLAEHRAASEALTAAGIPADMGSLAKRVALLHHDADQQTALASRLMCEKDAAAEAAPAVDVPDDLYQVHPLLWADRAKAMASDMPEAAAAVFRLAVDRAALVPGLEQANREAHQGIAKLKRRLAGQRCGEPLTGPDAAHPIETHDVGAAAAIARDGGVAHLVRDGKVRAIVSCPVDRGDAVMRTDGPIVRRAAAERADEIDRRWGVDPESERRLDAFLATTAPPARKRPLRAPMTAALPDLGIVAAHGSTPQALAEDVASQVLFVVRAYALAAPESLAPDAIALRGKIRVRLGLPPAAEMPAPPAVADPWLDEPLTSEEQAALDATEATPGAGEPW